MSEENYADGTKFDLEATTHKIKELQQQNKGKLQALAKSGKGVDAAALANMKIDTFIEMFLDKNAQAAYVLQLETRLQEALNLALSQVRQEILLNGNPPSNTLLLPR